ncbi:MAG TPA: hypothetical protein VF381_14245 [Thermoanaerobaculia bacterium]
MKIGADVASPDSGDLAVSATRTDISLDPATASGVITSVKVYWSNAACSNAFTITFFRRAGDLLIPGSKRGPFSTTSNVMTVELTPAVSVGQGDLIGITRLSDCGNPGTATGVPTAGYLSFDEDVKTNRTVIDGQRAKSALAVFASAPATNSTEEVLPAVGSVRGVFGSSFKTSLQLLNPTSSEMTGWITFTPHGVPQGPFSSGVGYGYSIPAGQQISVDLAEAFTGSPSTPIGLGTLDVEVPTGQARPQIIARVYNDAGTGGTAGFYEDPVALGDTGPGGRVISAGSNGFMVTPVDPTRTRFNIGVRSFFSGADLTAQVLDNAGHVLATTTRHYPANYFEQVDAAAFFGGVPVGANETIKITVTDGSAAVYGATTDNVTNDPSVQYALVAPAAQ